MQTTRSKGSLTDTASGAATTGDRKPALGQTSPREAREADKLTIRDITDGSVIAWNFTAHLPTYRRGWIVEQIAEHFECEEDAVRSEDTEDGYFYTINGKPAAYIEGEYEPLFQLLQAAE